MVIFNPQLSTCRCQSADSYCCGHGSCCETSPILYRTAWTLFFTIAAMTLFVAVVVLCNKQVARIMGRGLVTSPVGSGSSNLRGNPLNLPGAFLQSLSNNWVTNRSSSNVSYLMSAWTRAIPNSTFNFLPSTRFVCSFQLMPAPPLGAVVKIGTKSILIC